MCVSVQEGDHRMLNKKRYLCKTNIQMNINMCVSVQDVEEESTQDKKPGELTCVSLCRKESTENWRRRGIYARQKAGWILTCVSLCRNEMPFLFTASLHSPVMLGMLCNKAQNGISLSYPKIAAHVFVWSKMSLESPHADFLYTWWKFKLLERINMIIWAAATHKR